MAGSKVQVLPGPPNTAKSILINYSFSWTFPFYHADQIKLTLKKPILRILDEFKM